jgi:hypothetical protein
MQAITCQDPTCNCSSDCDEVMLLPSLARAIFLAAAAAAVVHVAATATANVGASHGVGSGPGVCVAQAPHQAPPPPLLAWRTCAAASTATSAYTNRASEHDSAAAGRHTRSAQAVQQQQRLPSLPPTTTLLAATPTKARPETQRSAHSLTRPPRRRQRSPGRRVVVPARSATMARVYADVNANEPRSYWDYDSVNIAWGALENYEVVRKIGKSLISLGSGMAQFHMLSGTTILTAALCYAVSLVVCVDSTILDGTRI